MVAAGALATAVVVVGGRSSTRSDQIAVRVESQRRQLTTLIRQNESLTTENAALRGANEVFRGRISNVERQTASTSELAEDICGPRSLADVPASDRD